MRTLFSYIFLFPLLFLVTPTFRAQPPKALTPQPPDSPPNILLFIADDWSYPHAGVYGDPTVNTPNFDALTAGGMLFTNAYCAAPSCSPSRASILTGRYPHQNGVAGNLWSEFPAELAVYPRELEKAGYFVGHDQKGWGPGDWKTTGWPHNPAGAPYQTVQDFLDKKKEGQPFCFWFGTMDPHRKYQTNLGVNMGMDPESVVVPGFLPDLPCVRNDIMDYFAEIERFDRNLGYVMQRLRDMGELDNTLIIVTSDNGMPFPRAKANLYDYGSRMPLVMHWPDKIPAGTVRESFVNLASLAPTILEAAGVSIPAGMTLPSVLDQCADAGARGFSEVLTERERHAQVRKGNLSYPVRALRTDSFLYIRNFEPGRWPGGDPEPVLSVGAYGDVDNSITKSLILGGHQPEGDTTNYFDLCFAKRPAEELYDVRSDPYQLKNLVADPRYAGTLQNLRPRVRALMTATDDPRVNNPQTDFWDKTRYTPTYGKRIFDNAAYVRDYRYDKPVNASRFESLPCH